MSQTSKIEWTDATFNGWIGCTKISPACDHCYAAVSTPARTKGVAWGAGQPRERTSDANWRLPLKWNELASKGMFVQCDGCGLREFRKWDAAVPPGGLACCSNPECNAMPESESTPVRPRVFCSSLADVFDNEVPVEWLVDLLDLVRKTPNLDWLILTKRIGRVTAALEQAVRVVNVEQRGEALFDWLRLWRGGRAPANVWLGATICNQAEADRDVPKLLATPARVRFLSMEPLLGSVDLSRWLDIYEYEQDQGWHRRNVGHLHDMLDWVIVGGESGHYARAMHPDWARSLRDQCEAAEVPFLMKQWGEWLPICEMEPGQSDALYKSNRKAGDDERQSDVDELFGRTCTVPMGVLQLDGRMLGILDKGAWGVGAMSVYKIGKKAAGRRLNGRHYDGYPLLESVGTGAVE